MRQSWALTLWGIALVAAGMSTACSAPSGGGTGFDHNPDGGTSPPPPPPPPDPRPPEERACPTGATLSIELHHVYATPLRPDNAPWDGVSDARRRLSCNVGAASIRVAIRRLLDQQLPEASVPFDQFVGRAFEEEVARLCGLVSNWLQMRYEGPDMFVRGGLLASTFRWNTSAEQDSWVAPRPVRAPWPQAVWRVPCRDRSTVMTYDVFDEDLAFNDQVESGTRFVAANIEPEAICGGWGWLDGQEGLVGTLFRLQVQGGSQSCAGIVAHSFRDFVIEGEAVGKETPPSPTPPGPTVTGGAAP